MGAPMPPHGQAMWTGGLNLPAHTETRSILTGDKLMPVVEVGCVILPDAMNSARQPGRHGMVYAIDHDPETGEAVYHVLTHRQIRDRTEAWTFPMPASEVTDPHRIVPESSNARHGYAKAAMLAASSGRWFTEDALHLVSVAIGLVRDCVWGRK